MFKWLFKNRESGCMPLGESPVPEVLSRRDDLSDSDSIIVDMIIESLENAPEKFSARWYGKSRIEPSVLRRDFGSSHEFHIMEHGSILRPKRIDHDNIDPFRCEKLIALVNDIIDRDTTEYLEELKDSLKGDV
jgi:hypothetical protein